MIPKIIHFCWLSGEPFPDLVQKCISSWKKNMPDFEFICWTSENFDISSVNFVREAVECKKWAFASDYIRLYALYTYGGIYLDSDVFVLKSFEPLLNNRAFSSIEYCVSSNNYSCNIEAAIIGAEKGHPWIKDCLEQYKERPFILEDGSYNQVIIPEIVANVSESLYGFVKKPCCQKISEGVAIYSPYVLAHAYIERNTIRDTYAIHLCEGSWYTKKKVRNRLKTLFIRFSNHPVRTFWMLFWYFYIKRKMKTTSL